MKIKLIAAMSIATAAALPLAAVANACGGHEGPIPEEREFVSPSGNIACLIYLDGDGANCEIQEHTWVMPASTVGPYDRPCDFSFGGLQFYISEDKGGVLGCFEGASRFTYPSKDATTLDYGQTVSLGKMTCSSEVSGVTCTDTATGHFFRVSKETYALG